MYRIGVCVYLSILGWFDLREKKVPVILLGCGTVAAIGRTVLCIFKDPDRWQWKALMLMLGALPGAFMIILSWLTRKVGAGDGWALVNMGLFTDYKTCMFLWAISLLIMSLFSAGLLIFKKVKRSTKIPYLPFLALVQIFGMAFGGKVV